MAPTNWELSRLLRPVVVDDFFANTWEKQPLAIARSDGAYYNNLFSLRELDSVLAFSRPKFSHPEDFKEGNSARPAFIQGWLADDDSSPQSVYPDLAQIHQAYSRGKTVILTAMQNRVEAVALLCRSLESFFGCPVHANLYLTPPGAQGFDPHHDTHEVFVLQLEGTKHWRFYGALRQLPLAEERATYVRDQLGPPTKEMVVQPGDLLYMPRGHIHEAFTSDTLSMHLTLGVKVYRWVDLLHGALDELSRKDVRLRGSLRPGLLTETPGPPEVDPQFHALLKVFRGECDWEGAVNRLAGNFLGQLGSLPGNHFSATPGGPMTADTMLRHAEGMVYRVMRGGEGQAILQYSGGYLEGPAKIARAGVCRPNTKIYSAIHAGSDQRCQDSSG